MDEEDVRRPLGWVPIDDRGSLPFALVHGESLVATASWALGEAGVELIDQASTLEEVREAGRALVLHDPLCPLTPVRFLQEAIALSAVTGDVVAGYRPVTDTVKPLAAGLLGETVDRAGLRMITSPVVVPPRLVATLEEVPSVFADLADRFAGEQLRLLEAPALGGRVRDEEDLLVLEALSRAAAQPG